MTKVHSYDKKIFSKVLSNFTSVFDFAETMKEGLVGNIYTRLDKYETIRRFYVQQRKLMSSTSAINPLDDWM